MSREIKIVDVDKNKFIAVSIPHLLDSMSDDDRKAIVAMATEDEVFMECICRAVATSEQDAAMETSWRGHDTFFWHTTKTRLRAALVPLLGAAVAEELQNALAKAEKHERAHRHLESLCHIESLKREATTWDEKTDRHRQWVTEYEQSQRLFAQYLPTKAVKQ
jgi:hypothetical protein